MKKFYTFMLSMAVAGSAFAFSPLTSQKVEVTNSPVLASQSVLSLDKATATKTANAVEANGIKKSPAKAPTSASDLAGEYIMDISFNGTNGMVETNTTFQISGTSDPTKVTISNFLGDIFGQEVNTLNATLYEENLTIDEAGNTEPFTILSIDLAQTLFPDDYNGTPVDSKLYLYGSFSGDGKNYVYTGSEIEFIVEDGALIAAYTGMCMWVGFQVPAGLYGYPAIMGPNSGADQLVAYKSNATIAGEEYVDDEETAPFSGGLMYALIEDGDQSIIRLLGLMGFNSVTEWVVDKENWTATATNNVLGQATIKFKKYDVVLMDENAEEEFTAVGTLSTNADDKTVMTFNANLYAMIPDQGWYSKYVAGTAITFDKNLFPGSDINGISNAAIDNSNAPVEYYNLQGMKVNAPAAGTIVIRRQGKDVKKVIM